MSRKTTLENRRILITAFPEGIGPELCRGLIAKKGTLIVLAKSVEQIKDLESDYSSVIPILLDMSKCPEENRKILSKLPYLDHIINFSGSNFTNVAGSIPRFYRAESGDLRTTKADDVVSKLILAGTRCTLVNFSDTGSSSNLTGSSVTLAATRITDTLRSSFRKIFRGKSLPDQPENGSSSSKNGACASGPSSGLNQPRRSSTVPIPGTKSQTRSQTQSPEPSTPSRTRNLSLRLRLLPRKSSESLKTEDEKLKKSLTKLHKEFRKVWEKKLKKLKEKEGRKLAELNREMSKIKKAEVAAINAANAELNDATLSRAGALSPETANKIIESREKKAERDGQRLAERKFADRKVDLEKIMEGLRLAAVEKHYHKIIKREIALLEK